jgi:Prominin.
MTALELSTVPLLRQLNQSISHLKTIQYFVQEHATSIAGDQTRQFLSNISDHIAEYRKHISTAIKTSVGKCHQVFIDVRETTCVLCTLGFNMLNMFWLCMFLAVVTLYVCAFVSNRLVVCLKKQVLSNFNINNGHVIHAGDGSGWNTPRISEERSNW